MKKLTLLPLALAAAVAGAQTTNQSQIRHVQTSLNHLTVLQFGEPVTTLAVADPDSFKVERHDDKVFVMPLREKTSTNLFVWTASRQLSYELDPAGGVTNMDVSIIIQPPAAVHAAAAARAELSDEELRRVSSLILSQTLLGVQEITHPSGQPSSEGIQVVLEQLYRTKDQLYIRYSITNQTSAPFRLTTPDVSTPLPTQQPVSLVSLCNHQLPARTYASFKAKPGSILNVVQAEFAVHDLAPGQKTIGIVGVRASQNNPAQLYQLAFGNDHDRPITVQAVFLSWTRKGMSL